MALPRRGRVTAPGSSRHRYLIAKQGDDWDWWSDETIRRRAPVGRTSAAFAGDADREAAGRRRPRRREAQRGSSDRRGLLVVISDLRRRQAVEAQRRAVRIGHEVAVFHVLTRDELEFPFGHDVELEDLESGRTLSSGPGAASAYRRAFAEFVERWRARCTRERIDYMRILTDAPLNMALRDYLRRRTGKAAS